MSKNLLAQATNSINFVQKLFFEISYLIKEIEGLLGQEEEKFVIGRPSGYSVNTRTSSGLEPLSVDLWLPKSFTVFFCKEEDTVITKGQSITKFKDDLKLILLDIKLTNGKSVSPKIAMGSIYDIKNKRKDYTKFERLMWQFTYNREKVFNKLPKMDFEDSYTAMKGEFVVQKLFDINSSEIVVKKLIEPVMKIYRKK